MSKSRTRAKKARPRPEPRTINRRKVLVEVCLSGCCPTVVHKPAP